MAKELMEIGGFITEGAEIVNHDASLSGNGTVDSPLGLNETVLWSGTYSGTSAIPFTESYKNFDYVRIDYKRSDNLSFVHTFNTEDQTFNQIALNGCWCRNNTAGGISFVCSQYTLDDTSLQFIRGCEINIGNSPSNSSANKVVVTKVVGINRKAQ